MGAALCLIGEGYPIPITTNPPIGAQLSPYRGICFYSTNPSIASFIALFRSYLYHT